MSTEQTDRGFSTPGEPPKRGAARPVPYGPTGMLRQGGLKWFDGGS
jgi:hypothetical protein